MSAFSVIQGPQPLLPHALALYRLGVSVIPITAGTKRPAVKWRQYQHKRADEATLRSWFADTDNGQLGIGVVLGQVSGGLLVRDFDNLSGYRTLTDCPKIASFLPTVRTYRGYHVWFTCSNYSPPGAQKFIRTYADGELRGDGHIVVAPPTIHPQSGIPYHWLIPLGDSIPCVDLAALGITLRAQDVTQEAPVLHSSALADGLPDILAQTRPTGPGQRHHKLFSFARHLRGYPETQDADARALELYVRQWHEGALPFIRTKDYEQTRADFHRAWPRVRHPAGQGSLSAAAARAASSPIPDAAKKFRSPKLRLLVALCQELQRERGERSFFLSCRDAARILRLTGSSAHVQAWRWLGRLCAVGILVCRKAGSLAEHQANEYRFLPPIAASGVPGIEKKQ